MLNSLSMTKKMMVTLVPLIVAILLAITLILKTDVTETSTAQAVNTAHLLATEEGQKVVAPLSQQLQQLKGLVSVAKARLQISPANRREYFNNLLKQYLIDRPELIGSWTIWEPNAFDGLDDRFKNSPLHDATGRFVPYWHPDTEGKIVAEASIDYETPGAGDYYLLSKKK